MLSSTIYDIETGAATFLRAAAFTERTRQQTDGSDGRADIRYRCADGLAERTLVSTSDTDAVVSRTDNGKITTYSEFAFNPTTGRLETWTEQPGGPLTIVNSKKAARVNPLRLSVRQQYVQNKDVIFTIIARNKNRQMISVAGEAYVGPSGRSARGFLSSG